MVDGKKAWSDMSEAETSEVLSKVKGVLDSAGDLGKKISVKVTGEYVNDLKAGTTENKVGLSVSGNLGRSNAAKIDDLKRQFTDALSSVQGAKVDLSGTYGIGDKVDPIDNCTVVADGSNVTFAPEAGTVTLIDFWATWCPPCQGPMAHNQEMLAKHGGEWGDKVKIYGFSIDNSIEPVKQRIDEKGWTSPIQYHVRNGTCQADKLFSFRGIPFCVLLDTEGKVVFMGHPSQRKFEDDFKTLLDGGKITGAGTTAGAGDDDDEEGGSGGKAMSGAELTGAVKTFQDGVDASKTSLTDAHKNELMRCFLVLVQESTFDADSGSLKTDLKHYQVFVGKQAAVTAIEEATAGLRSKDHPWEPILRKQAM